MLIGLVGLGSVGLVSWVGLVLLGWVGKDYFWLG